MSDIQFAQTGELVQKIISANQGGNELPGLFEANLRRADLTGADLRLADLYGADLTGADLRFAYLTGADLREANLRGAYLSKANLSGADLYGADLSRADLRWANLTEANLSRANLGGADLRKAIIAPGVKAMYILFDPRGYALIPWYRDGQLVIKAGCYDFTVQEALDHWGASDYEDPQRGALWIRFVKLVAETLGVVV